MMRVGSVLAAHIQHRTGGTEVFPNDLAQVKFEVETAVALLFSCPGLFWTSLEYPWAALWFAICVALASSLLFEASSSHRVLSEICHEILKGAIVYPAAPPDVPPASTHHSSPL
jgi:hypothetical protein